MNLISNEINDFINDTKNSSYYGIELNNLLKYLTNVGNEYKKFCNDIYNVNNNEYNYFSGIKLIINNIWSNYKNLLKDINQNFNNVLKIQNNTLINSSSNYELNKYYYFANDFTLNIVNTLPIDESFIYKIKYYDNNFFIINNCKFTIMSNNIFSYYLSYKEDLILPKILYKINY